MIPPVTCLICSVDIEHLLHLFFDCTFARSCWQFAGLIYDMQEVESAPQWVLNKLETAKHDEVVKICITLWGIWFWHNKKVWHNHLANPQIAMENSFRILRDWKAARQKDQAYTSTKPRIATGDRRWKAPEEGVLKLNVDASFVAGECSFSVGMVLRDHEGVFLEGGSMTLPCPESVFEAECIGVREALSWLMSYQGRRVVVETDSLLTVRGLYEGSKNLLEVGHVIDHCKRLL